MDKTSALLDVIVCVLALFYGIKFFISPPHKGDKGGLRMRFMLTSDEAYYYGNKLGGLLFLIFGIILSILTALKYYVLPQTGVYELGYAIIEALLIFGWYFLLRFLVIRKYGKPEPLPKKEKKSKKNDKSVPEYARKKK